jgi:hypothetical protein
MQTKTKKNKHLGKNLTNRRSKHKNTNTKRHKSRTNIHTKGGAPPRVVFHGTPGSSSTRQQGRSSYPHGTPGSSSTRQQGTSSYQRGQHTIGKERVASLPADDGEVVQTRKPNWRERRRNRKHSFKSDTVKSDKITAIDDALKTATANGVDDAVETAITTDEAQVNKEDEEEESKATSLEVAEERAKAKVKSMSIVELMKEITSEMAIIIKHANQRRGFVNSGCDRINAIAELVDTARMMYYEDAEATEASINDKLKLIKERSKEATKLTNKEWIERAKREEGEAKKDVISAIKKYHILNDYYKTLESLHNRCYQIQYQAGNELEGVRNIRINAKGTLAGSERAAKAYSEQLSEAEEADIHTNAERYMNEQLEKL